MESTQHKWTRNELLDELRAILDDQRAQYAEREVSVLVQAIEEIISLRAMAEDNWRAAKLD